MQWWLIIKEVFQSTVLRSAFHFSCVKPCFLGLWWDGEAQLFFLRGQSLTKIIFLENFDLMTSCYEFYVLILLKLVFAHLWYSGRWYPHYSKSYSLLVICQVYDEIHVYFFGKPYYTKWWFMYIENFICLNGSLWLLWYLCIIIIVLSMLCFEALNIFVKTYVLVLIMWVCIPHLCTYKMLKCSKFICAIVQYWL